MELREFAEMAKAEMPFEPTRQQSQLMDALTRFCSSYTRNDPVFILNGYAGTGKTTVMGALVRSLNAVNIPTVLLASTGRAAKVFANFTGMPAHTIHRKIYRAPTVGADGKVVATLAPNQHENTVFIVDEASMIGQGGEGGGTLLEDLIMYVYSGINCRLILLGDTAQLPPVGLDRSPAMEPDTLKKSGLSVSMATMTKTVRQKQRSGILYNATLLRNALANTPLPLPEMRASGFNDVAVVAPEDLEEALQTSFSKFGEGNTILITRSNRRAVDFNLAIRRVLYDREELLAKGERLIVAKNNYYWTRPSVIRKNGEANAPNVHRMDFVANGETAIVEEVYSTESVAGMEFANVRLFFPDHDYTLEAKINLATLTSETAQLDFPHRRVLADNAMATAGIGPNAPATAIREVLKQDPHCNALEVKYAYAVTCHKAQGGQWASVFVDMGYIPPEAYQTPEFFRWLYTAVTRATTSLTLINPNIHVS